MVTVRKLISMLNKMPKNLDVGVAMNDNSENEVAGWVCDVIKIDEQLDHEPADFEHGKRCVVLRC